MLGYATDLRSRTQSRATHTMQFERYEPRSPDDGEAFESPVGTPQRPRRPPRSSTVALPEADSAGERERP
jgi:translation elongation factor EF-G